MTTKKKIRQDKRTTVSLAQIVWEMAEERMDTKGFNDNFSAYIADLIRRDKEAEEQKLLRLAQLKSYPNRGDGPEETGGTSLAEEPKGPWGNSPGSNPISSEDIVNSALDEIDAGKKRKKK